MRFGEIVLILLVATLLIALWIPFVARKMRQLPWRDALPVTLALVTAGQIFIEGYRWQMLPVYLLVSLLIVALYVVSLGDARRWWQWGGLVLGTLLLGIAFVPPILIPVPDLPDPTGRYDIGTTSIHMIDEGREEIYGDNKGAAREFMVQIWYPAEEGVVGRPAPFLPNAAESAETIAVRLDLPAFALGHATLVNGNARLDVPVSSAEERYPLLVFSHGYESLRGQSTTLMEELASHGYIVMSMEHTYGASMTIFPDGRIEFLDPITLSGEGEAYDANARLLSSQWQGDILYALDELALLNEAAEGAFAGKVDFERLGVFGHSTGGGTAVRTCQMIDCVATVGLDAWFGPVPLEVIDAGADAPTFFFMSESWSSEKNTAWIDSFMGNSSAHTQWLTIADTAHYDFTDIPFLSPLTSTIGLSGEIDATRGNEIVRTYTLAFFDWHIKGGESGLFDGASEAFPEVTERMPK